MLVQVVLGQDYYFVREGGSYRIAEKPIIRPPSPIVDTRPVWKRALYSLRPWTTTSPGTRFHYAFWEDHVFKVDGGVGIGVQGKIDF